MTDDISVQSLRPQKRYREELLNAVEALKPGRLLEVGCGGGGFLRSAAQLDVETIGIDPDPAAIEELRRAGFNVRVEFAEDLEFPDQAFDGVIFSFTAHHIANWNKALLEAVRVSRGAVLVLDPWYETGIPSQSVAERFDRWCKKIDRARGMVHNDCLTAAQWLEPLMPYSSDFRVKVTYLLDLFEMGTEHLTHLAANHLGETRADPIWLEELDKIIADSHRHGFSDDGAVLLEIQKCDRRDN